MKRSAIIVLAVAAFLAGAFESSRAVAQNIGNWDGTWSGTWVPCCGTTSITIVGGRVARYEYKGQPVAVTISKVERSIVTFGVADHYAIRITRLGPNTASATYKSLLSKEVEAADLIRN